ncbi:MAG: response regulator, partial [Bacillota bacterium]
MSAPHRILLVDDNPGLRLLVERELQREFGALKARHIADADGLAGALAGGGADAAVIDARMHWSSGLDVLRAIKSRCPDCAVIMFAADGGTAFAVDAMKAGVDDFVIRPASCADGLPQLRRALRDCLAHSHRRRSLRAAPGITAPRTAEAEAERKARLLAEAQRVACIGSWELDLDSNVLTWSDEHYRILGLEPGAIRP